MIFNLFKAKSTVNGSWVTGELTGSGIDTFIRHQDGFTTRVHPKSVCQFTGFNLNGTDLYTKDLIEDDRGIVRTVFAVEGGFVIESNPVSFGRYQLGKDYVNPVEALADEQNSSWLQSCKVIGNLHDHDIF